MDEYFIEEKTTFDKILDFLVFISVLVVTIFLLLDIFTEAGSTGLSAADLQSVYLWVSVAVLLVFSLDLVRLWKESEGGKDFFEHNWLDVLATIPFELLAFAFLAIPPGTVAAVGVLKWIRFAKLSRAAGLARAGRVSKISRQFKAASHLKKEGEEYKKKQRL